MNKKGLLLVLSGPSGVGKGTVGSELLRKHDDFCFSVSATTRPMRSGEAEGVNYFYKTDEQFDEMIKNDAFLEYMCVFGKHRYGTPKEYVMSKIENGINVLLDIDVQGAMKVKSNMPDAVTVFILPPSLCELKNRLIGRNTETAEAIERRLAECKVEISYAEKYDYVIVNDKLEDAVSALEDIIKSVKCKSAYNNATIEALLNENL